MSDEHDPIEQAMREALMRDYLRGLLINETYFAHHVPPPTIDRLWAAGWRHFGRDFFRYNFSTLDGRYDRVIALRIVLARFRISKSQRRTLRRNADLTVQIGPARLDDERRALFNRHATRFSTGVPAGLDSIISERPDSVPCQCVEVAVRDADGRLLALSYLDLGSEAASTIYAVYEPDVPERRLGIFTMLCEIDYATRLQLRYYYTGYATVGNSRYDYKKCFHGLEQYSFGQQWQPLARNCGQNDSP